MENHTINRSGSIPKATIAVLCLIVATAGSSTVRGGEDPGLDQILRQMESVGKTFVNFKASILVKKYTVVLREFDLPESGEFFYARAKDGSALIRQEITKPARRVLTIKGGTLVLYQPGLNQASVVSLGNNKDKAEYLAMGIGQSPGKLRESFDLKHQGIETVNGAACSVLILKPKNPAAAAMFATITLWIKKSSGVPIQQKLQEPNGDYLLVSFTDEKLNTSIPASLFEQQLPKGVEIIKM